MTVPTTRTYHLLPMDEEYGLNLNLGAFAGAISRHIRDRNATVARRLFLDVFSAKFLAAVEKDPAKFSLILLKMDFRVIISSEKAWVEFNDAEVGNPNAIIFSEINLNENENLMELENPAPKTATQQSPIQQLLEKLDNAIKTMEQNDLHLFSRLESVLMPSEPHGDATKRQAGATKMEEVFLRTIEAVQNHNVSATEILRRLVI